MPRKRYTAEQIITKLREAEVELAKGQSAGQASVRMHELDERPQGRKEASPPTKSTAP